jgi:ketosteroid isomerase-like protein
MSRQHIEAVEQAFEAYRRRDLDAFLELLHPDVEVRSLLTELETEYYHGHDGVREWYGAVFGTFPDWGPTVLAMRQVGDDAVVTSFHVTATASGSGAPVNEPFWQGVRFRGDKAVFFGFFRTEEEARGAGG